MDTFIADASQLFINETQWI